jgi:hypothetical protein
MLTVGIRSASLVLSPSEGLASELRGGLPCLSLEYGPHVLLMAKSATLRDRRDRQLRLRKQLLRAADALRDKLLIDRSANGKAKAPLENTPRCFHHVGNFIDANSRAGSFTYHMQRSGDDFVLHGEDIRGLTGDDFLGW